MQYSRRRYYYNLAYYSDSSAPAAKFSYARPALLRFGSISLDGRRRRLARCRWDDAARVLVDFSSPGEVNHTKSSTCKQPTLNKYMYYQVLL